MVLAEVDGKPEGACIIFGQWPCRLLGFPLVQVMMEPLWAGFVQSSTMAAISYGWEGEVGVVGEEGRLESS